MSPKTSKTKESGAPGNVPVEHPTRNYRVVEKPVILSDTEGAPVEPVTPASASAAGSVPPATPQMPPAPSTDEVESREEGNRSSSPAASPGSAQAEPLSRDTVWAAIVQDGLRTVETVTRPATAGPSANDSEVPVPTEPAGTIAVPEVKSTSLYGPITGDWPAFPRREGSFTFVDLVKLGRADALRVDTYTQTDAAWAISVRERFLRNHWLAYQVPASLPCDRSMVLSPYDGFYLEGTVAFLEGRSSLPASVDPRFWVFDVPTPSQAGTRSTFDMMRTQWTVSCGFGRVITFAEHDAFRVDESPAARYDVVVRATGQQTQYRIPVDRFPLLPPWIRELRLPGGLCIRLPRVLMYFGSEVAHPSRFAAHSSRLSYTLRLELARSLANALDSDLHHAQMVWVLSEATIKFLEEFSQTPKVEVPLPGGGGSVLRGIDETADLSRKVRSLPEEYLFERLHVPSGERVRWAFIGPGGFVAARSYSGPRRGGRPVVRGPAQAPRATSPPGMGYHRGFPVERRSSAGPRSVPERHASLSSLLADREVRGASRVGTLLYSHSVREGGWTVRQVLGIALDQVEGARQATAAAEARVKDAEGRLAASQRRNEAWREYYERSPRPTPNYADPYAPDGKRTRYSYDPYPRVSTAPAPAAAPAPAGGSVPGAGALDEPYVIRRATAYERNPYATYDPQSPYYR